MKTITIDGMDEHAFRHGIENMLRLDQVDEAIAKLRTLLEPIAGEGGILPARFLNVSPGDIEFAGWQKLGKRLSMHDRPTSPISAIGITLADARNLGGPGPSGGRLPPFIKTFYFGDDAFPFSIASRDDLLDGYTRDGFEWEADFQASDVTLSIKGLDDLYGAVVELEERLFDTSKPDPAEVRAGSIGACYIAALIHAALRETIRAKGLPRPLCVLVACDGVYPFFDAPVVGCEDEEPQDKAALPEDGDDDDIVWPVEPEGAPTGESSLLSAFSRKGTKQPVLIVTDEDVREAAHFIEMAEAEWLVVEDRDVLTRLPDRPLIAEAAPREAFDSPGGRFDLDDLLVIEPDLGLLAAVESADVAPLNWADAAVGVPELADDLDALPEYIAPARNSLRARINVVEPDYSVSSMDRIRGVFARLRKLIFRR
ncbi:MAG: hypothetical protein ABI673_08140 [Novosphingobium sp.]